VCRARPAWQRRQRVPGPARAHRCFGDRRRRRHLCGARSVLPGWATALSDELGLMRRCYWVSW
jgi:hypothetical protein